MTMDFDKKNSTLCTPLPNTLHWKTVAGGRTQSVDLCHDIIKKEELFSV